MELRKKQFFFQRHPGFTLTSVFLLLLTLSLISLETFIKPRLIKSFHNNNVVTVSSLTYTSQSNPSEASIFEPSESYDPNRKVTMKSSLPFLVAHKDLGYSHPRSVQSIVQKTFKDEVFNSVTYSFDEHRRRITPLIKNASPRFNALFFGCSFLMGDSLEDDQTIPYYFSQLLPEFRSFNYAIGGTAAPHMLYQIEHRDFSVELPKSELNVAFYVYADGHLPRTSIDAERSTWLREAPYYNLVDGELKFFKNFITAKPNYSIIYDLINKSSIAQKISSFISPLLKHQSDTRSVKQLLAIIKKSKETYEERVPKGIFYVLLFPGYDLSDSSLRPLLEAENIKTIELELPEEDSFRIHEKEAHLNQEANLIMASHLSQELSRDLTHLSLYNQKNEIKQNLEK